MKKVINKNQPADRSSGFTIIETLVAITILMIAITGPLTVAHKGLTAAVYARDQMIASYLAQDAIEYVKNVRDSNKLASRNWLYGFNEETVDCIHGNQCTIDTTVSAVESAVISCSAGLCTPQLFLEDSAGGRGYNHTVGRPTTFSRVVTITQDPLSPLGAAEAKLTSVVSWQSGTIANSVTLTTELFDTFR